MKTTFPDPDDILNFTLTITPDEGLYKGGQFNFSFAISQNFPHEPPKVKCKEKIYHPNIDRLGRICLDVLKSRWNLTLQKDDLADVFRQLVARTPDPYHPPLDPGSLGRAQP